eukprot:867986-Prymnesium_polylepis.1
MGELGPSPCPEECRGASNGHFAVAPMVSCRFVMDRAEVPCESARLLKVPGTVLPDMEGGRRGWVGSLA